MTFISSLLQINRLLLIIGASWKITVEGFLFINFLERGEEEEEDIRKGSGSRVMDKDSKK